MSQRKAQGVELQAQDPIMARVRAVTEAAAKQREELEKALGPLSAEEKVECLVPVVLDLLQRLTGLSGMVIPMAANMDLLLRDVDALKGDVAELRGRLMFSTPPLSSRA